MLLYDKLANRNGWLKSDLMISERPVFIVNADDLGLAISANEGIFRAFDEGCLSSASFAVTTAAFEHALRGIETREALGLGLHFSLSAGHPVADPADVPLLVDDHNFLNCRFLQLMLAMRGPRRAELQGQVAIELDAQLQKLRRHDVQIDHINGERHVHLIPGVFEVVARAARNYGIPHIRLIDEVSLRYLQAGDVLPIVANGGWAKFALLRAMSLRARGHLRTYGEPLRVRYASILFTGKMDRFLERIWADPPAHATELAVHPGLPQGSPRDTGTGNAALESYLMSRDRGAELQACIDLARVTTPARVTTFGKLYSRLAGQRVTVPT